LIFNLEPMTAKAFRGIKHRLLNLSLKRKLLLSFLAVTMIGGVISLGIGTRLEHRTIFSLAQAKVRHDLSSAWMVYNERLNSIADMIRLSAHREFIRDFLPGDRSELASRIDALRREFRLDILSLTDSRGRVILRSRRPENWGDDLSRDPLIRQALGGRPAAGTQIVTRTELLREGDDLADRAYFKFISTPKAAARSEDHEPNGMMLKAAAPILDDRGRVGAVLYGGLLLNRNYEIVDRVKEVVFKGEKYKGHDIGTATIFLGDLRIATNVLDDRGGRAVGTRVSREVNDAVLMQGGRWVGRAFVVKGWYITAYEPVRDIDGRVIGMLYVGMLENPYIDLRNQVMGTFTLLAGLLTAFILALVSFFATNITRPLQTMVEATEKISRGDLDHRLDIDLGDEIGHLAASFNRMTENLDQANENLTQWGRTLEKRVEERTQELREMQDALIKSEKLASLGKMAAGVAHEINNPLTSILINTHLILERIGNPNAFEENLATISEETARCALIVKGLLEFARQTPAREGTENINDIIDRTLQLLEKQANVHNVVIARRLGDSLPLLRLDKNKIQQVFSNLIMNAREAMPRGGTLTITSRLSEDRRSIEVLFADTGEGIPPENMPKLFDPFFTTKSFGTGLGLSVSYGIIQQTGGTIEVTSEVGKGSVFTVRFRIAEGTGSDPR
jgi:two-component system NtrC family sensor kinase